MPKSAKADKTQGLVDVASQPAEEVMPEDDFRPTSRSWWARAGLILAGIVVAAGLSTAAFAAIYSGKIYPGVSVDGIYVGGQTKSAAKAALAQGLANYQQNQIPIQFANTTLAVDVNKIGTTYDLDALVNQAYYHGRSGTAVGHLRQMARAIVGRPTLLVGFSYDDSKLAPYLNQIDAVVDAPVSNASLSFGDTGRVVVTEGSAGQRLDVGRLVLLLQQRIGMGNAETIQAPIGTLNPSITVDMLAIAKSQAESFLAGPLTLNFTGVSKTVQVPTSEMIKWLKLSTRSQTLPTQTLTLDSFAYSRPAQNVTLAPDDAAIAGYVASLAKSVDRQGQNAQLTIENNVATVFRPSQTGYQLDQTAALSAIKSALGRSAADRAITVNVKVTQPDITEQNLNSLGINELISEGVTYFPGSPPDRMQNIRVGASRFNGILVKPGDTFSFESLLGNVDAAAGYAPALVILGNKEVYQYGGGMCQVSSTAFRAALLAGLPIVERHNHSFAVSYYTAPFGVPGVDATVFDLNVDFKFRNDTGHYILIQTILSGTTLKFDFYGTKTKSGQIRGPYFSTPAGGAGWNSTVPSTTYFYRDVLDLNGNVTKTDTFTEHYASSLDFPVVRELN